MKNDWLTTASFERAFETVSAINVISIHHKLLAAGIADPSPPSDIGKARETLTSFIEALETLVANATASESAIVVGVDPRFSAMALHYIDERRRMPPRSKLYTVPLSQLNTLLRSDDLSDNQALIECLDSLRTMVEEVAQTDVAGMFGEE